MSKFGGGLKGHGYDQEEAYFHKLNQELIRKVREKENSGANLKLVEGAGNDLRAESESKEVNSPEKKKAA